MKALFAAAALACIITLSGCESRSLNENPASCAPGRAAPAPQAAAGNGKTPEIQKPGQNDKAARFKAMLANRESVEKDDRYVYTANGTERIGLVEQFMWNVERNKPGRLTEMCIRDRRYIDNRLQICFGRRIQGMGLWLAEEKLDARPRRTSQKRRPVEAAAPSARTPQGHIPLGQGTCRSSGKRTLRRSGCRGHCAF